MFSSMMPNTIFVMHQKKRSYQPTIIKIWRLKPHTFKSASNAFIELFTTSSVNSGNSLRLFRKDLISFANASSCSGKSSTVNSLPPAGIVGRAMWGNFLLWKLRFRFPVAPEDSSVRCFWSTSWSTDCLWTRVGNKSAAFSRKMKRTWTIRSRRWKADESIPTEDPSCLVAFAKLRSSRSRLFIRFWNLKKASAPTFCSWSSTPSVGSSTLTAFECVSVSCMVIMEIMYHNVIYD